MSCLWTTVLGACCIILCWNYTAVNIPELQSFGSVYWHKSPLVSEAPHSLAPANSPYISEVTLHITLLKTILVTWSPCWVKRLFTCFYAPMVCYFPIKKHHQLYFAQSINCVKELRGCGQNNKNTWQYNAIQYIIYVHNKQKTAFFLTLLYVLSFTTFFIVETCIQMFW